MQKEVKNLNPHVEEIRELCNKTVYKYKGEPSGKIHKRMQYTLLYWARKNNYTVDYEYHVPNRGDDSDHIGKIDLRIVIEGKVYLIEFDISNKMKSVRKLLDNPADYRLWVRAINESLIMFYYFHDIEIGDIIVVPVMNWSEKEK